MVAVDGTHFQNICISHLSFNGNVFDNVVDAAKKVKRYQFISPLLSVYTPKHYAATYIASKWPTAIIKTHNWQRFAMNADKNLCFESEGQQLGKPNINEISYKFTHVEHSVKPLLCMIYCL